MNSKKLSFTAKRRMARESSLKILYSMDVSGNSAEFCFTYFFDLFWEGEPVQEVMDYTKQIVFGFEEKEDEINKKIQKYSENWTLDRMVIIDRNILRYAIFELFYVNDVPPLVSINESIEIGKRYGTRETKRFINGILDKIVKTEFGEKE